MQDSLALVDFYNSTNGDNWTLTSENLWKTDKPVAQWNGVTVTGDRVTAIWLAGNHLSDTIPSSFGNLTALVSLTLLDNQITSPLPSSMVNLTSLVDLHLGANYFAGNIPSFFGNMTQLKTLNLSPGFYTGDIPSSFANLINLQSLDVSYNQITGFNPADLENLNQLSYLGLNNNHFTFKELEPLVLSLKNKGRETILYYDSQASINISRKYDSLFVSPGGSYNKDTLRWYKRDSGLILKTIDTFFVPRTPGNYYAIINNAIATELNLYSDTMNAVLAENDMIVTTNISGTDTVNINNGFFNIANLKSSGPPNGLSGNVTTSVFIDPSVSVYNNQPYVQRHFDIKPAENADKAQAVIVLFFTQQDFDNYNNYVISNNLNLPLLPSNGINNGNVRITQLHGSFTGSSTPGNYDGTAVSITPYVSWDRISEYWVVTFYVSGFSGFYLNSGNFVLPLTLMEFNGHSQGNKVTLNWITSGELNTKQFSIERNNGNGAFAEIGQVNSQSTAGNHQYNFVDANPLSGNNYYRLKMVDNDGAFTYSNIVFIKLNQTSLKLYAYPNPANDITTIIFNSTIAGNYTIELADVSGKIIKRIVGSSLVGMNKIDIDLQNCTKGIYFLTLKSNESGIQSLKIRKL